jgi:hypothetical protein
MAVKVGHWLEHASPARSKFNYQDLVLETDSFTSTEKLSYQERLKIFLKTKQKWTNADLNRSMERQPSTSAMNTEM